jgi:type IV pilus assembly protein PilQ
MAVCLAAASLEPVLGRPMPPSQPRPAAQTQAVGGLQLRVRRLPDAVELVLQEAGLGATLTQQPFADRWQGELRTERPRALQVGPQALALPAEGLEQIRFEGSGTSFRLTVLPTPGRLLGSPVVSSDGRDLVVRFPAAPQSQSLTWMPNLNRPTPVPTQTFVPPLRPLAVAPPVGDMAVGTMTLRTPGYLNLSGPNVTTLFKNAPSSAVLFELARLGGYGFVYVPDSMSCVQGVVDENDARAMTMNAKTVENKVARGESTAVTLMFSNEKYSNAFNGAVRAAGWSAVLEGRTIFAGPSVKCDPIGPRLTKVFRLNQADPESAVAYLASLGALGKRPSLRTVLTTSGPTASERQPGQSQQQDEAKKLDIELFRSPVGPLLGLEVSFDTRLGLITMVGSPNMVSVGEQYLRQFDLRKRQVALTITIIDLNLTNDSGLTSAFAYRSGDNFIVNDIGRLFMNFGGTGQKPSPSFDVPDGDFVGFLKAQIDSRSAKILASPTLIMQEGESTTFEKITTNNSVLEKVPFGSLVTVGSQVITGFEFNVVEGTGTVCRPIYGINGLTMYATVNKVDDNGFVSFNVSPTISAPVGSEVVPGCGVQNVLNNRNLISTNIRVRDGQTLVLTGVISEEDKSVVTKWPILGDIPIIGSFFRSSGRNRSKRELVMLVTPRIVDDNYAGLPGYAYRPASDEVRRVMNNSGYP